MLESGRFNGSGKNLLGTSIKDLQNNMIHMLSSFFRSPSGRAGDLPLGKVRLGGSKERNDLVVTFGAKTLSKDILDLIY